MESILTDHLYGRTLLLGDYVKRQTLLQPNTQKIANQVLMGTFKTQHPPANYCSKQVFIKFHLA